MAWVNIYEQPITPVVDLDTDAVVYVPGYAIKGPAEPTLVNSTNFTALFGDTAYTFDSDQTAGVSKNNILAGGRERSWIYAKGLVDSGLTVLYHRFEPSNAPYASKDACCSVKSGASSTPLDLGLSIGIRSKYFGTYYKGLAVSLETINNGVTRLTVKKSKSTLEEVTFSFNPESQNYLADIDFSSIVIYGKKAGSDEEISLSDVCEVVASKIGTNYRTTYLVATDSSGITLTMTEESDNFTVAEFEKALTGVSTTLFADVLKDTEKYPVSYITTGGYFIDQSTYQPGRLLDLAAEIKACYSADFADDIDKDTVATYLENAQSKVTTADILNRSFGFQVLGADTFKSDGFRVVLPDSFGYFVRLGQNVSAGLPSYTPIANNAGGIVANAFSSTRPIDYATEIQMISNEGVSINPIITKKNVGYVIMGNRTLYPNDGVLGPQSFLNCRVVVNAVERSARRAANKLRIVSTNAETAFKNFRNMVEKTCDKLLTNGDGLAEYSVTKLPKTKPATIDIQINLVVVEGIETWNINIPYSIALD